MQYHDRLEEYIQHRKKVVHCALKRAGPRLPVVDTVENQIDKVSHPTMYLLRDSASDTRLKEDAENALNSKGLGNTLELLVGLALLIVVLHIGSASKFRLGDQSVSLGARVRFGLANDDGLQVGLPILNDELCQYMSAGDNLILWPQPLLLVCPA